MDFVTWAIYLPGAVIGETHHLLDPNQGAIDRGHVQDDENVDRGEKQHRP